MPSGELLDAIDELEAALDGCDMETDELLQRLDQSEHQLRLGSGGIIWVATIARHGMPLNDMHNDPAVALRSVLVQLPAPTEPPPESEGGS
jgi:hypothetical protein